MPCFSCILERDNYLRKAAIKIRDAGADGVRSEHELGQRQVGITCRGNVRNFRMFEERQNGYKMNRWIWGSPTGNLDQSHTGSNWKNTDLKLHQYKFWQ